MNVNLLTKNKILILLFVSFVLSACGVNEDQRNFEDEALSAPNEITEMTASGQPIDGESPDESDWRIAPKYGGLVTVSTAPYPNPVPFNGTVFIEFYITGIQAISGLQVFVFQPAINALSGPFYVESQVLTPGLKIVTLSADDIARTGTETTGLFRIIIYDGLQNIITYGDILINE